MAPRGKGRHRRLEPPHYDKGARSDEKSRRKPLPTGPYAPATVTPIKKDQGGGK
jgi:hypothetical protein